MDLRVLLAVFLAVALVTACATDRPGPLNPPNSGLARKTPRLPADEPSSPAAETVPPQTPPTPASLPSQPAAASGLAPASGQEILIGVEYAVNGLASHFGSLGIPAVKYFPEELSWAKMQPRQGAPINFARSDKYVRDYQAAGFTELVFAFKTQGSWAVRDALRNFAPKPEHLDAYEAWVRAVVERYDKDGTADMPGLAAPVRYFEVGTEFSSYEPEPVADYLEMLERAYRGAHAASDSAAVMHAAFLATTAFRNHPTPDQYEAAFAAVDGRIMEHSLADIRAVLDRPDVFDAVNFHALGDPYEIEDTAAWLRWEMQQRGYSKPLVISDTAPTPFISWGPASTCKGAPSALGIMIPPSVEADRCRLAAFFTELLDGDEETVRWTQSFVAADTVKKVVVSAEQGVALIDTSFMEDLTLLKAKLFRAGAGIAPWGGMTLTDVNLFTGRTVRETRASYYALGQLAGHLKGYTSVSRLSALDPHIRLYQFTKDRNSLWIAWYEPDKLALPKDPVLEAPLQLQVGVPRVAVEPLITRFSQTVADKQTVETDNGELLLDVSSVPVFIYAES